MLSTDGVQKVTIDRSKELAEEHAPLEGCTGEAEPARPLRHAASNHGESVRRARALSKQPDRRGPPRPQPAADASEAGGRIRRKPSSPLSLLCHLGFHSWPRVHGSWREVVVEPAESHCRRCTKPIASIWRSAYPLDGTRCSPGSCQIHG